MQEFFLRVKDLVRCHKSGTYIDGYSKFKDKEKELNWAFYDTKTAVHDALCGETFRILLLEEYKALWGEAVKVVTDESS